VVVRAALVVLLAAAVAAPVLLPAPAAAAKPRLKAFDSCGGLVAYARRNALRNADELLVPRAGLPEDRAMTPVSAPGTDQDHSSTNVQERGVDEADTVKTEGRRLFAVAGNALHVVDARATPPRLLDSLPLSAGGHQSELLLRGDRLLVLSQIGGFGITDGLLRPARFTRAATTLSEVAVSDAGKLRLVRTLEADGTYLSARLTGATVRVVITSVPRALETPAETVRKSGLPAWMPRATLTSADGGERRIRRLVRCRAVRHTRAFSGLDMVTVLTIDLERGLPAVDADALMTGADTVYASPRALYVATRRWIDRDPTASAEPPRLHTAIHRFDASDRGRTVYAASGRVRGYLLSQWALSEHDGHLRAATTETPDWWGGAVRESESHVTVLRPRGDRLVEVGRVGGLGHGERIHGVRFIGDVGYVVTFRQTDPLYTVSLADPERPRMLGELKILGYSAYLHPVGDDLLLGVGQDATAEGRRLGTQLSLFDVSDPRRPQRLHQRALAPGSSSAVEWDHRAFLYWPATRLTVLPLDAAAAGFRVTRQGIEPAGGVSQQGWITRSAVIGDRLLTVSDSGVTASPLATLRGGAWLPFGEGAP
jgi:hypothetical protein